MPINHRSFRLLIKKTRACQSIIDLSEEKLSCGSGAPAMSALSSHHNRNSVNCKVLLFHLTGCLFARGSASERGGRGGKKEREIEREGREKEEKRGMEEGGKDSGRKGTLLTALADGAALIWLILGVHTLCLGAGCH